MTHTDNRAKRFAAEFVVIVLGVLLALAVDRWVAGLDLRAREASYLDVLAADFEANQATAFRRLQAEQRMENLGRLLLRALDGEVVQDSIAEAVVAAEVLGYNLFNPYARTAWDELHASGELLVLRDAELRTALTEFYRGDELIERLNEEFYEHIMSFRYIARSALSPSLRLAINSAFASWDGDFTARATTALEGYEVEQLLNDIMGTPQLGTALGDVVMARGVTRRIIAGQSARVDSIAALIQANRK